MRTPNILFHTVFFALFILTASCDSAYDTYYSDAAFDEAFLAELSPEERAQFIQDYYEEENDEESDPEIVNYQAQYISHQPTQQNQVMQNQNFSSNRNTTSSNGPTKTVQLYDRGYGMVMARVQIPQDWNVRQNLSTNRQNGSIQSYQLDYFSPNGQMIRCMMPTSFSSYYGQSFQSTWNNLMQQYLFSAVQNVRFQPMKKSQKVLNTKFASDYARYQFGNLDGFEQGFTGTLNGQAVEGVVYALYLRGQMEQLIPIAIISPRGQLGQTIAIYDRIDRSTQEDPRYVQMVHGEMDNRTVAHHKRMMAHNQRARQLRGEIYDIHRQQSEEFNRSIREEGLGYNGSRHTINDQVTDAIRGEMTIENTWSGEQERVDQSFRYWYTNPLGQKYGTNDPSFNPQTLPGGNWKRAKSAGNY